MSLPAKRRAELKAFLDQKAERYNQPDFIPNDPICIPHAFSNPADIEISGLFAAVLAWGRRATIIAKCRELMARMDGAPHAFLLNHSEEELKGLLGFCHRTFNDTDLLYFIHFLSWYYRQHNSLEWAFWQGMQSDSASVEGGLIHFHELFFSLPDAPQRSRKHIATPARNSACKRLNMYLRWMVRSDDKGVDFGLWKNIQPHQLVCPCDVHVERVARSLGLITRKDSSWQTAMELTGHLRQLDPQDPVRYDFALFGLGIEEGFAGGA
ncbi:TIGR02757 family protein [Cesiribacter andamanensis]|uniref:TIGR02757 family protein n=1 Tax=Cesiribacter andamanensis AMV16 TaxID=1279009 RepID=M7N631_9BACT|nr:TIGR02757 family protein [Cesiribacter andamanensis]EMR02696.1 hypothetical protein ADICEAN_02173 [Cesiribacter andamanensis AMV16]